MPFFSRAWSYVVSHKAVSIVAAVLIVGGFGVLAFAGNSSRESEVMTVTTIDLKDTVLINGKVRAAQNVDLSVEKAGRVTAVHKHVGDKVLAGDIIVTTYAPELSAQLERARAALQGAEARLTQLSTADRPEQIAISEQGVISAKAELAAAETGFIDAVRTGYVTVDDAIRNKTDQFIVGGARVPTILFPVADTNLRLRITHARPTLESSLERLRIKMSSVNQGNVADVLVDLQNVVREAAAYLNDFSFALNSLVASDEYPQATIATWKQTIGSARTDVIGVSDDITAASQRLSDARADLLIAQNQLTIKQTGGSQSDIAVQTAAVAQARADVSVASAALENTLIRAPFAGTVTRLDAEVGRTIGTETPVVALVSEGVLEIEGYIPEVSVSRIQVGNTADITLDAFGSTVVFPATVSAIDLSGQTVDGVQSYKVRLIFSQPDSRIKIGMTANARVVTATYPQAIAVPRTALTLEGGQQFVEKVTSESPLRHERVQVTTGVASDNMVQITSGLTVGDKIVVPNVDTGAAL